MAQNLLVTNNRVMGNMVKKAEKSDGRLIEDKDALQIYFNQIKAYPLLDFTDEVQLAGLIKQGNTEALHKLINSNLRLVVKIARPYTAKGVPFIDLIQEGNMGLIHAAKKYNPIKNVRFCTYAGWWVQQFIVRYLTNKHRLVRLPHRKEEILRKVQRTYHTLSQRLMHQPRTEDIADELGIPVKDIDFIINLSSGPLPLELGTYRNENSAAIEIHEDYTYNPERAVFRQYYREGTMRFLDKLKERERQVLSYRYELEDAAPHTLKEIGLKLDISPETVRQIEMRALAKIRSHADDIRKLGFLEAM